MNYYFIIQIFFLLNDTHMLWHIAINMNLNVSSIYDSINILTVLQQQIFKEIQYYTFSNLRNLKQMSQ